MRAAAILVSDQNTGAACVGMISGRVRQTNIGLFSGLREQFIFAKDQILKDLLDFGLREGKKNKSKPELSLSQTLYLLKEKSECTYRPSEHPPVRGEKCQNV